MKVLVLVADYPNNSGGISLFYVHTRNMFYYKNGLDVTVLNFSAKDDYVVDNINVVSFNSFKKNRNYDYDLLILHAANLRNHYLFLRKYGKKFKKHLFFFHGHEVLMCNKVYSKPYNYVNNKKHFQNIYDFFKLRIWHSYFLRNNDKTYYIFVSNWMKDQFIKWVKIDEELIASHMQITYNSVGEEFVNEHYDNRCTKLYDYVTIRGNLDGSKYCVDLINKIAHDNPNSKFLLVGKGTFFNHYKKANNLEWIEKHLSHKEIIGYLNKSKCALMPTRTDAQGLMTCEMATFGIPVITSNIPVCHEVLDCFDNVEYIENDANVIILNDKYDNIKFKANCISTCYCLEETGNKELRIIKNIIGG